MELVFGRDGEVAAWAARLMPIGNFVFSEDARAIGVAFDGQLIAAAVYHEFRRMPFGRDMQLSFAASSARWATKGTIRALLRYPFVQCECTRVTTIVSRKNKRARKLDEGLGFKLEGVMRKAYDGHADACVYGMTRAEAARWID